MQRRPIVTILGIDADGLLDPVKRRSDDWASRLGIGLMALEAHIDRAGHRDALRRHLRSMRGI
ncbi:MAG: hypothetical protein M3018_00725 [Actinomycetota bacterium]|nr:hypothetical protein [Actinomycetota bacterium]